MSNDNYAMPPKKEAWMKKTSNIIVWLIGWEKCVQTCKDASFGLLGDSPEKGCSIMRQISRWMNLVTLSMIINLISSCWESPSCSILCKLAS